MNNKENLVGKIISLFLEGGWQITGEVKSFDDDKFIVEQDGDLFMVFKNKVSCLLMSEDARAIEPVRRHPAAKVKSNLTDDLSTFPMNSISYDESGMSIPGTLLSNAPENSDDDFTVLFSGGNNLPSDDKSGDVLEFLNKENIKFEAEEDDTKD
jgi:sRNA-binding regulator protein Hfq